MSKMAAGPIRDVVRPHVREYASGGRHRVWASSLIFDTDRWYDLVTSENRRGRSEK